MIFNVRMLHENESPGRKESRIQDPGFVASNVQSHISGIKQRLMSEAFSSWHPPEHSERRFAEHLSTIALPL